MGINAITSWLNQNGYRKKKRQNNTLDTFSPSFIKGVIDSPIYCGKLTFRDLDLLTIGMVNDMFAESRNDDFEYDTLATQEDFDKF